MASLDIILNVEGTSDINALVNEVNKLEAQTKKMFKAFERGNITMKEAMQSFQQLKGVNEEQTMAMDRMIRKLAEEKRALEAKKKAQENAAEISKYLQSQQYAIKNIWDQKKATEALEKAEKKRNDKLKADAEAARRLYDPIYGATKKYEEALGQIRIAQNRAGMSAESAAIATKNLKEDYDRFVAAIKTGNFQLINGGNQFAVFGQKVYGARRKLQKFGSSVGQQVGYQVQDFFVQIQSGTDALVALGQQGSQLLGIFGAKGALAGAVLAIGTAIGGIAVAAYRSAQGLQDLEDALSEISGLESNLNQVLSVLEQSPVTIAENFTMAIEKVQQYLAILAKAEMQTLKQLAGTTVSSARSFLKTPVGLQLRPEVIADKFGITPDRGFMEQAAGVFAGEKNAQFSREQLELLEEYRTLAKEVLNAASPVEASDAFLRLEQVVLALGVAAEDLPEGFITAKNELAKFAFEYDQAAATAIKVNKALEKGIQASTENVDALRERIEKERLKTIRRAEAALEAAREKRRKAAMKNDERERKSISETEQLRRRLQKQSLATIQAAEERYRNRRRSEIEEQENKQKLLREEGLSITYRANKLAQQERDIMSKANDEYEDRVRIQTMGYQEGLAAIGLTQAREKEALRLGKERIKQDEEAAKKAARIEDEQQKRRLKNLKQRAEQDAIPTFDPRDPKALVGAEAEAYKMSNNLVSEFIDFDKRLQDRVAASYKEAYRIRGISDKEANERANDSLRIRAALETAFFKDTAEREANERKQANVKNILAYQQYAETRIKGEELYQDKLEETARQEEQERKARERANNNLSYRNQIEALNNELLQARVTYAGDEARIREEEVRIAGTIAAVEATRTTTNKELIDQAREQAEAGVRFQHTLEDQAAEARKLAKELREASKAMSDLTDIGLDLDLELIKARAQIKAGDEGRDPGVAGRIAARREENKRARDALLGLSVDLGIVTKVYEANEEKTTALAEALEILASRKKKSATELEKLTEKYQDYLLDLNTEIAVLGAINGLSKEEADIQRELIQLKTEYAILGKAYDEEEIERLIRKRELLQQAVDKNLENQQRMEQLGDFIGNSFENAMMSIVDGTKSVEDAFRVMAAEVVKELYRVLVVQQAVAAFKLAGKALGIPFFNADGNAFSNGNVIPYANGGVVSSPTYFPMAGGNTGLMGEAGPEAIMPLKRGKDGKLGVQAEGGGNVVVNQTINVSTGVQQTVRTEIKSLMPQIADSAKNAVLDSKRRGGSYGRNF